MSIPNTGPSHSEDGLTRLEVFRARLSRLGAAAALAEQQAADAREARDAAIEDADRDGWSVWEITRALDGTLTRSRVHRIVLDRTAARQARLTRPTE